MKVSKVHEPWNTKNGLFRAQQTRNSCMNKMHFAYYFLTFIVFKAKCPCSWPGYEENCAVWEKTQDRAKQ